MTVLLKYDESHGMQETTIGAVVDGPTDRAGLYVELLANLPATYGTLVLKSIESADLVEGHLDIWNCRVRYGAYQEKQDLQEGENEFRFSSMKRSIKRTISIASRCYQLNAEGTSTVETTPPDLQIIRWNPETKSADGVDETEYLNAFSWRVIVPFSTATEEWRRQVGNLRGSVCNDTFFGYDAESVLFDDITGTVTGSGLYQFELSFIQSPNIADVEVGDIEVGEVKGWEVIDVSGQQLIEGTVAGREQVFPKVSRVKIHQTKPIQSFAPLAALLGM